LTEEVIPILKELNNCILAGCLYLFISETRGHNSTLCRIPTNTQSYTY